MTMTIETVAAIDLGSASIRMTVAEIADGNIRILEELKHQVRLGKDVFGSMEISRETIDSCADIIKKYVRQAETYKASRLRAVATPVLREASNIDIFLDNIRTATGLDIEILSPAKRSEYIFRALTKTLETGEKKTKDVYEGIIDISAGHMEITLFDANTIIFSRSLPLSATKIKQLFSKKYSQEQNFGAYLKVMVEHELANLKRDLPASKITRLYGIGAELEELSGISGREGAKMQKVELKELEKICAGLHDCTLEETAKKLKLPYDLAETFYLVNTLFSKVIGFFECDQIFIPKVSIRDGILQDMAGMKHEKVFYQKLENQLRVNALNIGRSLNFDETHALKVTELALKLFEGTKEIHNLGGMERCYLLVAALLHDIGSSISYRLHHKHSLYIINSRDFFYLDDSEKNLIANVARYHRRAAPKNTHPEYMALSHKQRMTVMKLSALLRLADSLDNTHLSLVEDLSIAIEGKYMKVLARVKDSLLAETFAFDGKKDLFEKFFGYAVTLEEIR